MLHVDERCSQDTKAAFPEACLVEFKPNLHGQIQKGRGRIGKSKRVEHLENKNLAISRAIPSLKETNSPRALAESLKCSSPQYQLTWIPNIWNSTEQNDLHCKRSKKTVFEDFKVAKLVLVLVSPGFDFGLL